LSQSENAAAPQAADSVATHEAIVRIPFVLVTLAIAAGALWLRLPGLQAGLHTDDYLQAAMLSGTFPAPRSAFALYDFGGRDAQDVERLRAFGFLPWWTAPDLKLAMFRPLSSATIAADAALWPESPGLRHAHSALWFLLLFAGVALLLRGALPRATALLALLLFACEPALSLPLSWLPNRAALCACACAVWGLCAYARFRRDGGARWAGCAAFLFTLAALAGEYALPMFAFVVAYELVLGHGSIARRAQAVVLALVPACMVVVAGAALGFGTRSSGLYVSPMLEPARYAQAAIPRLPALAAELTWAIPASSAFRPQALGLSARDHAIAYGSIAIALLAMLALGRWLARHAPRELRWLGLGALLGWALLAGALPEARLLLPIVFGFDAVVAALLIALASTAFGHADKAASHRSPYIRVLCGVFALALCAVHLGVKPVRAAGLATAFRARSAAHTRWALATEADDAHALDQQWIAIAARDFTSAEIVPFARAFYGHPLPRAYRFLSAAPFMHRLTRPDARTLVIEVPAALPDSYAGSLQRPRSQPFAAGARERAGDIEVIVEAVQSGQPTRTRFVFPKSLDDAEYVFLYPAADGLRVIRMPPVGAELSLPPPRTPLPRP
jgi:hypothetical protein